MRIRNLLIALAILTPTAIAGACEVEDWTWHQERGWTTVEGATTCERGEIHLRLYRGTGDDVKFLGVESTIIEGYTFEAITKDLPTLASGEELTVRYSVSER